MTHDMWQVGGGDINDNNDSIDIQDNIDSSDKAQKLKLWPNIITQVVIKLKH